MGFPTHGLEDLGISHLPCRGSTTWEGCPLMAQMTRKGGVLAESTEDVESNGGNSVAWLP
ncbi:hypothetical protein [Mongoliitalea lutea]|uniref:hypothetical protein n=1 Tax=Mongoliitalea lutea TaxID=849756 RepID=UPI001674847F|nr:hypothetical protein [Mongoliitalea lutea]